MKRINKLITLAFIVLAVAAHGQVADVVVEIGDTLYFGACNGENYTYIDFFQKTRFEEDKPVSDTATSWNYYSTFFDTGDFDVNRMTCEKSGTYSIIKHMMMMQLQDNTSQMVFVAEVEKGKSAAYIIEPAFAAAEVIWSPTPR